MGKGDKKTRRGKITMGSFGKTRPHKRKKTVALTAAEEKAPRAKNKKG
ncbi:30S ribosomal protein THX [Olivibacter sp. CPCC 100613]